VNLLAQAQAFRKIATPRTLYHGTTIQKAREIAKEGLVPKKGPNVERVYDSLEETPDLVFAADKSNIDAATAAMEAAVAHELRKDPDQISPEEMRALGAIVVLRDAAQRFSRRPSEDDPEQPWDSRLPTVEPEDYFSQDPQPVSYILAGAPMIRLLRRLNQWPPPGSAYDHSPHRREQIIKAMRQAFPETDPEKLVQDVQGLTDAEAGRYYRAFVLGMGK